MLKPKAGFFKWVAALKAPLWKTEHYQLICGNAVDLNSYPASPSYPCLRGAFNSSSKLWRDHHPIFVGSNMKLWKKITLAYWPCFSLIFVGFLLAYPNPTYLLYQLDEHHQLFWYEQLVVPRSCSITQWRVKIPGPQAALRKDVCGWIPNDLTHIQIRLSVWKWATPNDLYKHCPYQIHELSINWMVNHGKSIHIYIYIMIYIYTPSDNQTWLAGKFTI